MKIVVIGGAGVFGSRLADLLLRDGHHVILAGRRAPVALADQIGAGAMQLDRGGDLSPLWQCGAQVVIDAAGPFHAYGDDPYRVARTAITRGLHYLDLADDAAFCAGISALDAKARAAGVVALSGVSSVPALSSAIVADLAAGADAVDTITSVILPGNRAPRGRAVIASILHQTGTQFVTTLDGTAQMRRSWSQPEVFDLSAGQRRRGYEIEVPDQRLFPDHFNARSVRFFAGLELSVMARGLALWSLLRHRFRLGNPAVLGRLMWLGAQALLWFGTDTGGMIVEVTTRQGPNWRKHHWRLIVRQGDGPFIPGVAARAIVRSLDRQAPGAGPALARITRPEAEAAMQGLAVTCDSGSKDLTPLFAQVLGEHFADLAPEVQASHATYGPRVWAGTGSVERGRGLIPRLIALCIGLPQASDATPITVIKTPTAQGETWERRFGRKRFRSYLAKGPQGLTERFGPLTFALGLMPRDGALHFPVGAGRMGPIPLPKWLLPRSVAQEFAREGNFHFDVALYAPITGQMIVHYKGQLARRPETE